VNRAGHRRAPGHPLRVRPEAPARTRAACRRPRLAL